MVGGDPLNEDWQSIEIARSLDIAVVVPSYRLAPEHPAPAGIDDVADGYLDVVRRATELKIDASRVAIGGASAGGGLAALLAQRLRTESAPQPKVQILVYPMLDDRTVNRVVRVKNMRAWYPKGNRWAWRAFLGQEPGTPTVPTAFVPARMNDLSGLPPAWIGVGTLDLFEAEDREYARRLIHAGVPCDVVIVDGAFHAFDVVFRDAQVTRDFFESWKNALRDSLDVTR
jgi:acetyl esterase/lipase